MARCPNCNKEISFFFAWSRGFVGISGEYKKPYIVCTHCGSFARLTKKSSSILVSGLLLSLIVGYGLSELLNMNVLFTYGIFIWFFVGWSYIFWKKFAVVELEDIQKVARLQRSKRIWRLVILFILLVNIIIVMWPPREGIQHIQSFLESVIESFKR